MDTVIPFAYDDVEDVDETHFPFPVLVDDDHILDSEWWAVNDKIWFVDSSGFGQPGEPALTAEQFAAELRSYVADNPEHGFAIIGIGQFQVHVGAFERK